MKTLINGKIDEIKNSIKLNMDKIKYLSSATTIKYIEEEVESDQEKIRLLEQEKLNTSKSKKGINMAEVMEYVTYFLEHLEELLIDTLNPLKRAAFFNLIFDTAPTYSDLTSGKFRAVGNKIEIWNKERYEQVSTFDDVNEISERMSEYGLII